MSLRHYNFITFLKKTLRKIEKKRRKRSENDVVDELEKNSQTRLAVVRIFLIPSTFRKERTRADARNSKGEKRGEEERGGEGGAGCIYIHARRLIIINPCLLPTVINLYSSGGSQFQTQSRSTVSLAHGIKGSSSLIYACRINLPLPLPPLFFFFTLSSPLALRFPFRLSRRVSPRSTWSRSI